MKFNETAEFNNFWCNDKFKRMAGKWMNFGQNIIEISNLNFLVSVKYFNEKKSPELKSLNWRFEMVAIQPEESAL